MKNFHKTSLAALNINNENLGTVYFNLTADYLCNFLPSQPNGTVYPSITISNFSHLPNKEDPAQFANLSNTKTTKYLLISNLSKNQSQNHQIKEDFKYSDKAKSANWRSESVLVIFVDSWLRYDFERELPGNEFMRLARILVKQLHFFSNVADMDMSSLSVLRRQASAMLNAAVYPFLNVVTTRWPLDTSFLNVLEFWLSYIQPWRYVNDRELGLLNSDQPIEIPDKYKAFVKENLNCYTQIFVKIVSRFLKMDLNSSKNVFMMFRMIKIFGQLQYILRPLERNSNTSKTQNSFHENSHNSLSFSSSVADRSSEIQNRFLDYSVVDDTNYVNMFSNENLIQINNLMRKMLSARENIENILRDLDLTLKRNFSTWEKILNIFGWMSSSNTSLTVTLEEKKKTKIYLDFCVDTMSSIYEIPIDMFMSYQDESSMQKTHTQENDSTLECLNPSFIRKEASNVRFMGDSLYLPIRSREIPFIARLVHRISVRFNETFEQELTNAFNRRDLIGKISRMILEPPEEIKVFNKSLGYAQMESYRVGPRLNLRNNYLLLIVFLIFFISSILHLLKMF
jgi:sphingomyelin phosphodiesterase 4